MRRGDCKGGDGGGREEKNEEGGTPSQNRAVTNQTGNGNILSEQIGASRGIYDANERAQII